MLVICEDCAKKYNIDESRIKSKRARFSCKECGHIIIIDKDDLTRSLLTGKTVGSPSPTLDLLREMEVPLAASASDAAAMAPSAPQDALIRRKNRGIPVFAFFLIIMLMFLVVLSLLFGYFYSGHLEGQYLADIFRQQPGLRMQFLLESSLIFGLAGSCILFLFCVLARSMHAKFKQQVESANQLSIGEYDTVIDTKGPREIRDMAFALERIRSRLKAGKG